MFKLKTIVIGAGMAFSAIVHGQTPNTGIEVARMQFQAKQVIPPSPEAAELGKYGNVPVSLFTGTPNISVPLVELKGNVLSLPVSLSYNASGFKPQDIAPWTGLGWALNAGGVITRSVSGNPDLRNNYFTNPSPMIIPGSQDEIARQTYYLDVRNKVKETQPDVYYYNFMGHSGKFFVQPDGQIYKKEFNLLKIATTIHLDDIDNSFTIVDEQGFTYTFTIMEKTNQVDVDDNEGAPPMKNYTFTSAWYLSSVTAPYGAEVLTFEYYAPTVPQSMYSDAIANAAESYSVSDNASSTVWPVSGNRTESVPPAVSILKKFLKKITLTKNGVVIGYINFESAVNERLDLWNASFDGERLLKKVKLYRSLNATETLTKEFDLSYGYSATLNPHGERRLLLGSIQEVSLDSSATNKPPHTFSYNTSGNMPPRFSSGLDHWGFYNGYENYFNGLPSLVPSVNIACCTHQGLYGVWGNGANREADATGSAVCMINKITYPTGGYTTFEFEGNDAFEATSSIYHKVGGIRIKTITDYSFGGKIASVKAYDYTDNSGVNTSGKIRDASIRYDNYSSKRVEVCGSLTTTTYTVTIGTNSIYGLGTVQGSHIGYERVTEYQVDPVTAQKLGKTVYQYKVSFYSEVDDDIGNGDLLKKEVYRNDGKLLQEEQNTYQYQNDLVPLVMRKLLPAVAQSNHTILCKDASGIIEYYTPTACITPPSCVAGMEVLTQYQADDQHVNHQNKQLTQQVQKMYDQLSDSYLSTTKNFTYGNPAHNFPTLTEEITNNQEKIKTAVKYVMDYSPAPGAATGSIAKHITEMQDNNQNGLPVEKLQFRQDAAGSNTRYISGQITDYEFGNPTRIYFLETRPLLTSVTASNISANVFNQDSHYRLAATMNYDAFFNLQEQYKTNDLVKSVLWDYNKLYPVAEILGAHGTDCFYTSFETDHRGGFLFSGSPTTGNALTGMRSYSMAAGSISTSLDPSKTYTLSYWRNTNTGALAVTGSTANRKGATKAGWTYYEHQVNGVNILEISGTGLIDEVRLYPSTAQMTTVTYAPFIGITSMADANSHIVYYEYDGLSRLLIVRDDEGSILKNYRYNYGLGGTPASSATTLFYNANATVSYTKSCTAPGTYGDVISYTVPYGKYVSAISQPDADLKATIDLQTNGQAYANSKGLCQYKNAEKTFKFFKNDCPVENSPGTRVNYTVPFGKYKSPLGQLQADNLAATEAATYGQPYANEHGTCFCMAEGQMVVDGTCETGSRINQWSELMPNGQWKCTYNYVFSNGAISQYYYSYDSSPCPVNP